MSNTYNYYHNLGSGGHRPTGSYNYAAHPANCGYYNPQLGSGCESAFGGFKHSVNNQMGYGGGMAPQPYHYAQGIAVSNNAPNPRLISADVPPPYQNQPATGGINPVLDYNLQNMSSFLSWCSFGMLKQEKTPTSEFESLVSSVLYATRLPISTIIISLEYMNQRFSATELGPLTEQDIFLTLVAALVLGNKFNDDNTFTNRSWCGATGLSIESINKAEKEWLAEVKWQLNVVRFENNIKTLEECWRTWLDKYSSSSASYSTSPVSSYSHYSGMSKQDYSPNFSSSPLYMKGSYGYDNSNVPSPVKYRQDNIWPSVSSHNLWAYHNSYYPTPNSLMPSVGAQYMTASNYVGYTNPYYNYNLAPC